jgi:hypothetical protein
MELWIAVIGFVLTGALMIAITLLVQRALAKRGGVAALGKGQRRRNTTVLWGMILLAVVYAVLLRSLRTATGVPLAVLNPLDGSIGLALGLYICAHPAANAVNMLLFERDALRHISEWSLVRWLALNLLVLLAGWMVIFLGLRRLVETAV